MTDLDAIRAMSDGELDAAIYREIFGRDPQDFHHMFCADLNAVAEVEAKLRTADLIANYADALTVVCEGHDWSKIVIAPARQRAEACLLAWRRMKGAGQ